jgi:hypothetical protein
MVTHPSHVLWAEVVRIARELHWSLDTLLDLEHPVRQRILAEIVAEPGRNAAVPGPRR